MAAYSLLMPDAEGYRAFDAARRGLTVAGMLRQATRQAATQSGWSTDKINRFVLGHGESEGGTKHVAVGPQRFAYLPLPSAERRGSGRSVTIGAVRRALLYSFADVCENEIIWAKRGLSGQELIEEKSGQPTALVASIPENDWVVRQYTQHATTWASVTPVILPGHDDPGNYRRRLRRGLSAEEQKRLLHRINDRIDGLLHKAIVDAGFSQMLADRAELEWRKVGFWPGCEPATRYGAPHHLKSLPRWHVRIRWLDDADCPVVVPGPICLGAGRFYGLGLFAVSEDHIPARQSPAPSPPPPARASFWSFE